jgi:hypothetical protein
MGLVEGQTLDRSIKARGLDVQQFFQLALPLAGPIPPKR